MDGWDGMDAWVGSVGEMEGGCWGRKLKLELAGSYLWGGWGRRGGRLTQCDCLRRPVPTTYV